MIHVPKTHKRLTYTPQGLQTYLNENITKKETFTSLGHQGSSEKQSELPHGPLLFKDWGKSREKLRHLETPAFPLGSSPGVRDPEADHFIRLSKIV